MTLIEMLRACGDSISNEAADEIERLTAGRMNLDKDAIASKLIEAENTIRDFAWRAECWSSVDIIAHVADYFGVTVSELGSQMDRARNP